MEVMLSEQGHPAADECLVQKSAVIVPITRELKENFSIATSMSQVINQSRKNIAIGPWRTKESRV